MKKITKFIQVAGLCVLMLGLTHSTTSHALAASVTAQSTKSPIQIYFNNSQATSSAGAPSLQNGTIMLPLDGLFISGIIINYDERTKIISIANMFTKGSIKVGERKATVNGKTVTYAAGPQQINKTLYLPLRFVNDAIGGTLTWNAVDRQAIISYPEFVGDGKTENDAYFLNGVNGVLYKRDTAGVVHSMGVSLAKLESGYIGGTRITSVTISEDADLVTIENSSGEPSINLTVINLFVKKGAILRQSSAHYWQFSPENLKTYNGYAVMNDGHTIRLIAPDASVMQTWSISKLTGTPDTGASYAVEVIGENYLIVRTSGDGFLTLIDLETKQAVLLYQQFGIEPTDMPGFKYDGIKFAGTGENESELRFEFTSSNKSNKVFTYQLGQVETQ